MNFAFCGVSQADRAILVGVNDYPNLRGANLDGPANDVSALATALQKRGFTITALTNRQATKQGILDALEDVKTSVKPDERVVFYFAGHGTKHTDGKGALVVSDSAREETSDLGADELVEELKGVKAKSKSVTVILDSCFSGAMSRSFGRTGYRRARLLRRDPQAKARGDNFLLADTVTASPETVNDADNTNMWDSGGKTGICYFTAATGRQVAEENDLSGKAHGIFSYYLVSQLEGNEGNGTVAKTAVEEGAQLPAVTWGELQMAVAAKVMENTDGLQQPTISQAFRERAIFAGDNAAPAPPQTAQPVPVWDIYGSNHSDSSKVQILMTPNKSPIQVGEQFRFDINVGKEGYLVILESGASGKVNLLFPTSRNIEDAKVTTGQVVSIPKNKNKALTPDRPGAEGLKAILFIQDTPAVSLLSKFSQATNEAGQPIGPPTLDLNKRGRDLVEVDREEWYTSDLSLQVVEATKPAN